MSHPRLQALQDATPLQGMDVPELGEVANEIRDVLCNLLTERSAHFASNLGVVELCLALHSVYDFRRDRLIWDTGHQIYPHKLITGRYHDSFHRVDIPTSLTGQTFYGQAVLFGGGTLQLTNGLELLIGI